jgi:hypothetical protein
LNGLLYVYAHRRGRLLGNGGTCDEERQGANGAKSGGASTCDRTHKNAQRRTKRQWFHDLPLPQLPNGRQTQLSHGGRRTTGEKRKYYGGFNTLNGNGGDQEALQLQSLNDLDKGDLLCSLMGGAANVATVDGVLEVRMGSGD